MTSSIREAHAPSLSATGCITAMVMASALLPTRANAMMGMSMFVGVVRCVIVALESCVSSYVARHALRVVRCASCVVHYLLFVCVLCVLHILVKLSVVRFPPPLVLNTIYQPHT